MVGGGRALWQHGSTLSSLGVGMVVAPVGLDTDLFNGKPMPSGMILHTFPINYGQDADDQTRDLAIGRTLCSIISTYSGLYVTDGLLICAQGAFRSFRYGGIFVAILVRVDLKDALGWLARIRDVAEIDPVALRFGEDCVRCFWSSAWWKAMGMPDPPKPPRITTYEQEQANPDDEYNPYAGSGGGFVGPYLDKEVPVISRALKRE